MKIVLAAFTTFTLLISAAGQYVRADEAEPIPGLPWVHEGTLVTSKWYAAKLFTKSVTFTQDDSGEWHGSDGKSYTADVHRGTDAGGITQTAVLAIDGDQVLLRTSTFNNSLVGDPARNSPDKGGDVRFVAGATKNTFCESPELLAKEASDASRGIIVRRVMWPIGGKMIDAIRIDKVSPLERLITVYDRNNGIGLHLSSVSSTGADSGSILMEYDLLGYRTIHVPWANESISPAVKSMKSMRLAGKITQEARFGVRPSGIQIDLTADAFTDKWATITSLGSLQLPNMAQPVTGKPEKKFYSNCEFNGLWIGPTAAAGLQQGQVLDEDPTTKMKTVVSQIDNNVVTITQSNTGTTIKSVYDRSTGLLLGSELFDTLTKFHTVVQREDLK